MTPSREVMRKIAKRNLLAANATRELRLVDNVPNAADLIMAAKAKPYHRAVALNLLNFLRENMKKPFHVTGIADLAYRRVEPPEEGFVSRIGDLRTTQHIPVGRTTLLRAVKLLKSTGLLVKATNDRVVLQATRKPAGQSFPKPKLKPFAWEIKPDYRQQIIGLSEKGLLSAQPKRGERALLSDVAIAIKIVSELQGLSNAGSNVTRQDLVPHLRHLEHDEMARFRQSGENIWVTNPLAQVGRARIEDIIKVLEANEIIKRKY